MNKIKAVIFDMDGVLIDAKEWHYESLNRALGDFGFKAISHDEHLARFDGLSTDQKLEMLNIDLNLREKINNAKQDYTWEIAKRELSPLSYHVELMQKLQQEGYKMALCSNSIRKTVDLFVSKAGLDGYMEFMLSNEDVKNKKPHPDIYIKAINDLGFKPQECLVVEDNINGIKAAKASGAHVLEVQLLTDVNYKNIKNKISQIENS